MITCQCAEAMRTYATQSSYLTPIPNVNIDRGVIPLDSLPADWWNWLWQNITLNEGYIVQFINSVFSEINSVLSAAGVSPSTASTTDLRDAIQALAQVVATSSVPGSVLSSTLSGKLNVIADGTATINGLGTPSDLQTTADNVVSAINEVLTLASGKAPTSHASSNNTYGVGTTQQFGHVKVTEGCGLSICDGTISLDAPGYNCLGNVTTICFNGNTYTPTDGVIDLGTQTVSVDCVCQRAISSSTTGDFYPILGGGLCRNTSGVGEVNLVGLSWNPVCCSLEWNNGDVIINGLLSSTYTNSIGIGFRPFFNNSYGVIAIGQRTGASCCSNHTVAIGSNTGTLAYSCYGIAIGYCATIYTCSSYGIAIGYCANVSGYHHRGIAIGYHANVEQGGTLAHSGGIAIGDCAQICLCSLQGVAIGSHAVVDQRVPGGVAIGSCSRSCSIICGQRYFYLNTIGNTFSLTIDVKCDNTYINITWGELAQIFINLFRGTNQYNDCDYVYLNGTGYSFCSSNISQCRCTGHDSFCLSGAIGKRACASCACSVALYWGNCWRCICCTSTGNANWIDIKYRHILVSGTISGGNGQS